MGFTLVRVPYNSTSKLLGIWQISTDIIQNIIILKCLVYNNNKQILNQKEIYYLLYIHDCYIVLSFICLIILFCFT